MSLVIVGSVALDSVRTPYGKVKRALGGSATYAGISASFFTKPKIVGVVGEDFPKKYIELMKKKKFDLKGLQIIPKEKTFHWEGFYEGDMSRANTVKTELNVFKYFRPDLPKSYRDAKYVFLANIDPELQIRVLDQVKNPRLVLCDTMNYWIKGKRNVLLEVFKRCNVVLVNEGEARMLTGEINLVRAADKLLKMGPEYIIVKKGGHGVFIISKYDYFTLPAYPLRELVDPTGAGDTFAGGFIGYLATKNRITVPNIRRAMTVGSILASYVCQDLSVKGTAELKKSAMKARLKEFCNHARIPKIDI